MTELEALRAEIDELRYDHDDITELFAEAIMRLKWAVEALAATPGEPYSAAEAALAALNPPE